MKPTVLYRTYVAATALLVPLAAFVVTRKLRRAGVSSHRTHEVLGHATENRQGVGPLIWFHAASVGESLSVLALITRMGQSLPKAQFLITSGTATSAKLLASRMPERCVHQFTPLDAPGPMSRFLRHWRPDAALFVESELWPQMLVKTKAQGAAMALINARLSKKSQTSWSKRPKTAAYVLDVFDLILTQNDAMAQAMVNLNAPADRVARGSNLKAMSDPLPVNAQVLADTRAGLKNRQVWVASSTHPGEERDVLAVHKALLKRWPDLCLILAPRHPGRAADVASDIKAAGLTMAQRTKGQPPDAQVYLADTLGELGTWYALAPFVFLGGSLGPIGGHNPFEVAQAGAAVLSGPHVTNFAETFDAMQAQGAAKIVPDSDALLQAVTRWLDTPPQLNAARAKATRFAAQRSDQLDRIAARLIHVLGLADD
ncbi:MAG: 3-deoxy-D-manno-octulosonic acid transferase [Sulfitobacter sp.]